MLIVVHHQIIFHNIDKCVTWNMNISVLSLITNELTLNTLQYYCINYGDQRIFSI